MKKKRHLNSTASCAPEILHLVNSEDGLEAIVTEMPEKAIRFRVEIRDTIENQTIVILTLPTRKRAEKYAHLIDRPE